MKNIILLIILILTVSCSQERKKLAHKIRTPKLFTPAKNDTTVVFEYFVDSLHFGNAGQSMLRINKEYLDIDWKPIKSNCNINIKLFQKYNQSTWLLKDSLLIASETNYNLNPIIADFNNDAYNDIIFTSGEAARGANNLQTLLLFKPKKQQLVWIKNSENFANLSYNKKRDCIIAWIFHGGVSTSFLEIQDDSLLEFAYVEKDNNEINSYELINGQSRVLEHIIDTNLLFSDFPLFCNYSPIEECE